MNFIEVMMTTLKKTRSNIANILTIGNLTFGGGAIMATLNANYAHAVLFIFIAGLLDRFDGMAARRLHQESDLGKQLDSMSDIISFGVAPAILLYMCALQAFGLPGMWIAIIYIACGAFRLARFNIAEPTGYFTGLPITAAGTLATLSYFLLPYVQPSFFMILMLVLAILMISTFSLKKV